MIKHKITLFSFYFIFVVVSFFNAPYLVSLGIDRLEVGYGYSLSILISIGLMIFFSYLIDKMNFKTKKIIQIAFIIIIISNIMIFMSEYKVISFIINTSFIFSITFLLDNLIIKSINNLDYSNIRKYGSLGAAFSYFLASVVLGSLNYVNIMILIIVLCIIIIYSINNLNDQTKEGINTVKYSTSVFESLKKRNIYLLLIFTFLTYGTLKADDPYTIIYNVEYVFMGNLVIGVVGFISIIVEFIIMNYYSKLNKKVSIKKILYLITVILAVIYFTRFQYYNIAPVVNVGNILMGVFVGLFIPTAVGIIDKYCNQNAKATVLSFFQISMLLGGMIISFITTYIYSINDFLPNIYLLHFSIICLAILIIIPMNVEN